MTQTIATYATAERDLEWLTKQGRFTLRSLAQETPPWTNDDERQAFLKLDAPKQAEAVLKALLERDKREKGGAGAGKAAAAPKATTARTPSNKGAAKDQASNEQAAPVGESTGNVEALLTLLNEIKANQEQLLEKIEELSVDNVNLQRQLAGNNKLAQVGVSLALQMSEQVLNAPADAVLQGAIDQLPDIEDTLKKIVEGDEEEGNG